MAERIVEIKLRATDESTPVLQRVAGLTEQHAKTMDGAGQAAARSAVESEKLTRAWVRMTDVTNWVVTGLQRMRSLIVGFAFGIFTGAIAGVVSKLYEWATQSLRVNEQMEALNKTVREQATAWGLIIVPIKGATVAAVELYNAQVRLAKFMSLETGPALEEQIKRLEEQNRQLKMSTLAWESATGGAAKGRNFFGPTTQTILENSLALAEARKKLDEWRQLQALTPQTVNQVTAAIERQNNALKNRPAVTDLGPVPQFPPQINIPTSTLTDEEAERLRLRNELMKDFVRLQTLSILGTTGQIVGLTQLGAITENEMVKMLGMNAVMDIQRALFGALQSALQQYILGQASLGAALKQATAQALASVAARALAEAIFMTAIGIAALTPWGAAIYGPAPIWFKAAGTMAGVGLVTLGAAKAFGAGGASAGPIGSPSNPAVTTPSPTQTITSGSTTPLPQQINIYINGNLVDLNDLSRELRPYNIQLGRDTI